MLNWYIQLPLRFEVIRLPARGFDSSVAGSTYILAHMENCQNQLKK